MFTCLMLSCSDSSAGQPSRSCPSPRQAAGKSVGTTCSRGAGSRVKTCSRADVRKGVDTAVGPFAQSRMTSAQVRAACRLEKGFCTQFVNQRALTERSFWVALCP